MQYGPANACINGSVHMHMRMHMCTCALQANKHSDFGWVSLTSRKISQRHFALFDIFEIHFARDIGILHQDAHAHRCEHDSQPCADGESEPPSDIPWTLPCAGMLLECYCCVCMSRGRPGLSLHGVFELWS